MTSRSTLGGQAVDLEPLTAAQVLECLRRLLVQPRVDLSDELLDSVVAATAGNPLAVRFAAETLQQVPPARVVEALRAERRILDAPAPLSGDRLAQLLEPYATLDPEEQRLFRLLGVVGDASFAPGLASALVEAGDRIAAERLERLVAAGLVERLRPDQYRLRGLAWIAALDRLRAEEPPARQRAAAVQAVRWLIDLPEGRLARDGRVGMWRAGYVSDSVPEELEGRHLEDHLNMSREVEALSWVVAAKDVDPPLSVGLFGDWGSGKSYFMRLMAERVKEIAAAAQAEEAARAEGKRTSDFPAYPFIRQITFNAWHYVDANLWASLVTYIFEELARPDGRQAGQEVENLLAQLQTTRVLRQEAEARKAQAGTERRRRTRELERVKLQRAGRVKQLERGEVRDKDLLVDEDVRARAAALAREVPPAGRPSPAPGATAALADGVADVLGDPELLRETVELVPDDAARSELLDLVDDPEVQRAATGLASDRNVMGQLAQLVGDPAFRASAIALIPGEARRREVAQLTEQVTQIYADVLALKRAAAELRTIRGKLGYVWRSVRSTWSWLKLAVAVVALAGVGAGVYLFGERGWTLETAVSVLAGVATFLGVAVPLVQQSVSTVRNATDLAVDAVDEKARRQIELLEAQEAQLQREVEEARRQEFAAERELEEIRQGRRLYRYIEERAGSADYRQYMGVIALVRKDFERLAELMDEARTARLDRLTDDGTGTAEGLPQIDRVILYIDDLDRCPATRVVEVLEAVHLLLALRLFVVVVGVDSRWLVRSLQRHYRAQLSGEEPGGSRPDDDWAEWRTTPQNYLEKIFQIAFSIRSMDRVGYESLLDALFKSRAVDERPRSETDGRPERQPAATPSPAVDAAGTKPAVGRPAGQPQGRAVQPQGGPVAAANQQAPPADPDQDDRRAPAGRPPDQVPAAKAPAPDATATPGTPAKASAKAVAQAREALDITAAELAFMKRLAPFVPTPRSAKRLANTYRLLRVLVTEEEAATFGPDSSGSGHYMVALTLLAILVGFPGQATTLFGELLTAGGEDWAAFRKRLREGRIEPRARVAAAEPAPEQAVERESTDDQAERAEPQAWERLCRHVDQLATTAGLPKDLGPYQHWCRRVARYSFQTGRLAMATGWDDDATAAPATATPAR